MGKGRSADEAWARTLWEAYLTGNRDHLDRRVRLTRSIFGRLPAHRRCRVCRAPFDGVPGKLASVLGFGAGRSGLNPTLCDRCETIVKRHGVGIELEMTMLFADVRGSTALAEQMGPSAFHRVIDRFYRAGVEILVESDALIEKLIGDEIAGLYVPGIAGPDHAAVAVRAARALMEATGHGGGRRPWIPVGAGVHTGRVYAGAVGGAGAMSVVTVLGDAANITARLASNAEAGEILISEATFSRAGATAGDARPRPVEIRGKDQAIEVRSLRPGEGPRRTT